MQSYVAATMVQLTKTIYDRGCKGFRSFCRNRTLLIERCFASQLICYGIDVYGQGIESARRMRN
ncbi:MAG: hypothetical protein ACLUIS_06330 [Longibaculum sp.]